MDKPFLDTVSITQGSGWVHAQLNLSQIERAYGVPTRYREVVLTVSKSESDSLGTALVD